MGAGKKWGVCVGLRTFHAGYPALYCMHACMQGCAFENLSIEFRTVRKSTRMWGLSRAINEPRSTFLVRGMSTSTSSLQNSFKLWLTQHHPSHADADLYNICSNSFESNYSHYSTWSLKTLLMTMYSNSMFGGESEEECAYESWNLWSLMTQRKTSRFWPETRRGVSKMGVMAARGGF